MTAKGDSEGPSADELDDKRLKQCAREAENYISNCKKFEVDVDPSVVIALSTGWNILKPSKSHGEGSLLPLMGILEENSHITKINLADVTMQDGRFVLTVKWLCSITNLI